jgi:hypothetical protein
MTVLLVLFTFTAFLLIDYFRTRRTRRRTTGVARGAGKACRLPLPPRLQPALVGGFAVPENLRYHPGHTWALSESTNLVRVGMDDFASKLTGTVEKHHAAATRPVDSPGPEGVHRYRDDCAVDMVSPIEGTCPTSTGGGGRIRSWR